MNLQNKFWIVKDYICKYQGMNVSILGEKEEI